VLGHAIHQAPKLLYYSLYELLLVAIVLPELSKNVVLFARVFHPGEIKKQTAQTHQKHKPEKEKSVYLNRFTFVPLLVFLLTGTER